MTKKQVLFWRFFLIIIILGGGFILLNTLGEKKQNLNQIFHIKKTEKTIDDNINDKEIELSIRPDDFYKQRKNKN